MQDCLDLLHALEDFILVGYVQVCPASSVVVCNILFLLI